MEPEFAAIESLCLSLLSTTVEKKESRSKLISIFNGCANDWLNLFRISIDEWPPSADDLNRLSEQARRSISLLIVCSISHEGKKHGSGWIEIFFNGLVEAFVDAFACDIMACMRLFFVEENASRYELRQLQLEFKEKLAVSFPSKGFMTEYLLNCDDIDDDLTLAGVGDEPLWQTNQAIIRSLKLALFSIKDNHKLSRLLHLVSPPLLQILDKTTDHALIMSGLELANYIINILDSRQLAQGHFDCVLLEALLNIYWVWSIGSHKELANADNYDFVSKTFDAIDTLLDKDALNKGDDLDFQIEIYKRYLKSRSESNPGGTSKKPSKTRIDPKIPHLGKVEQYWCQVLQISQSLNFSSPDAELHVQKILSIAQTKLYPFISRNLSVVIRTTSIVALSAKFSLSVMLLDFLIDCIVNYCFSEVDKFEGDLLVLLVDYAHQAQTKTFQDVFGPDKCQIIIEKLVDCLEALIDALRKQGKVETLLADWDALQGVEQLDLSWARGCFIEKELWTSSRF